MVSLLFSATIASAKLIFLRWSWTEPTKHKPREVQSRFAL